MGTNGCKNLAKLRWSRRRRSKRAGHRVSAVDKKVKKLQRLIPGGEGLQPDLLFLKTADYIMHLRLQVHVLQALSKIYMPSSL